MMAPWLTTGRSDRPEPDRADCAGVSDYQVAVETYRAAVKRWPGAKITLRNPARLIEKNWED
jgi:hypothetical protein